MGRRFRLALPSVALLALLVGASPVAAAGGGADFGACRALHATTESGFTGDHTPGMHGGFSGWAVCPGH